MIIELNDNRVDWITMTFNKGLWESSRVFIRAVVDDSAHLLGREMIDGKQLQYQGLVASSEGGSVFLGHDEDGHCMMRASGWVSHGVALRLCGYIEKGANVTRMDVQRTIQEQEGFQLIDWVNTYDPTKYRHMTSGEHNERVTTIYRGSRQSERFIRLYEKLMYGRGRALRFEVECKGGLARAVARGLHRADDKQEFLGSVIASNARMWSEPVVGAMFADAGNPSIIRSERRREKAGYNWVMRTCMPAIAKRLEHRSMEGDKLCRMMEEIIDRYKSMA